MRSFRPDASAIPKRTVNVDILVSQVLEAKRNKKVRRCPDLQWKDTRHFIRMGHGYLVCMDRVIF